MTTEQPLMSATSASLLAGAVAGSIGIGVAFPLDTLKTKAQVREKGASLWQVFSHLWNTEGVSGFFKGVRTMMIGQAIIKSAAFAANTFVLTLLMEWPISNLAKLLLAGSFSGFLTSFLVVPFERVKLMMQAASKGLYHNAFHCLNAVVKAEGISGLMGRGLGPTFAREIPSYIIYFGVSGFLLQTSVAKRMGKGGILLFGAVSGCACWLPVYPIDVVKTLVQNTEGGRPPKSSRQVAKELYQKKGITAFFDGLTPKMLRAAVNHAVTFFVYQLLMDALLGVRVAQ
jgi:hypothetical protein